jgi:hypothetical protein
MQTMGKLALAASAMMWVAGNLWVTAASAQDYDDHTTTTRTEHYDSHRGGAYVGVPGVAGVHIGPGGPGSGCETHSKTVQDNDTGESHTRTVSNC